MSSTLNRPERKTSRNNFCFFSSLSPLFHKRPLCQKVRRSFACPFSYFPPKTLPLFTQSSLFCAKLSIVETEDPVPTKRKEAVFPYEKSYNGFDLLFLFSGESLCGACIRRFARFQRKHFRRKQFRRKQFQRKQFRRKQFRRNRLSRKRQIR